MALLGFLNSPKVALAGWGDTGSRENQSPRQHPPPGAFGKRLPTAHGPITTIGCTACETITPRPYTPDGHSFPEATYRPRAQLTFPRSANSMNPGFVPSIAGSAAVSCSARAAAARPVRFRAWLSCALLVAACAPPHARLLTPTGGVLAPGATQLNTTQFRDASLAYKVIQAGSADARERQVAQSSDTTQLTTYNGVPAILLIQGSTTRGRLFSDSALVLRDGLSPVWEVQHAGTHVIRIDYSGRRVRRTDSAPDTAPRHVDHMYDVPVFHFNELTQLVRSIPLHAGYHAILPLYSEGDDALEMDTVRVEGQDSAGVWNVRFADKVIIGHYGIDGNTREMVRYEVERHAGGPHFYLKLEPSR